MKKTRLSLILPTTALITFVMCFILLNRQQDDRKNYESFLIQQGKKLETHHSERGTKSMDEPQMAAFQDFLQTMDPAEKRVPVDRLHKAYRQIREEQQLNPLKKRGMLDWEIVPSNMGGRTRAIMFDPNSATGNKVWAGGVTGGLWYNEDITSALSFWIPVDDLWPSLAISSITYDPNNPQVYYVGTGEAFTARVIYRESSGIGAGIFKSEDAGQSWQQMQSTLDWKYVTDIEVRNENGSSVIYAGVASGIYHGEQVSEPTDGLYRSTDGGATWEQVLPDIELTNDPYAVADIEITAANRIMIGSMANLSGAGGATILYSDEGLPGTWSIYDDYIAIIEANPDYYIPNRVMIGSAPSNPDVAYALLDAGYVNSDNDFIYTRGRYIIRTNDGGATWAAKPIPSGGNYYWASIGWHALTLGIDPNNENAIYIGGLDVYKSSNGGNNWTQVSDWTGMYNPGQDDYVHADIHDIDYKPGSSDELAITSDGGVFYTEEAQQSSPVFQEKNMGYGTLQFYTCGIHPTAGTEKYVGGLQDNGTLYYTGSALSISNMIDGGDGSGCFIDQTQPQYMITSVYYNAYTLFQNGNYYASMSDWSSGTFISPADYDDDDNILFANACSFGGDQANQLLRIKGIPNNITGSFINLNTGLQVYYSAVECSPHSQALTTNLFIGSLSGRLYKVTNAQATPQVTEITGDDFPEGAVSSIAIGGSEDTLLVTFSNYGVSSVWQTYDAGSTWEEKEANLPDMPVRWALYYPGNSKCAMLATELGIWTSTNLNDPSTQWNQDIEGLANVRVDMLQLRASDNTVLAATHGRGLATAVWDISTGTEEHGGLDAGKRGGMEVWPNPTAGVFNLWSSVSSQQSAVGSQKLITVDLLDLDGKVLLSYNNRTIEQLNNGSLVLDITRYPAGIYFIRLEAEDQTIVKKIIKL